MSKGTLSKRRCAGLHSRVGTARGEVHPQKAAGISWLFKILPYKPLRLRELIELYT